MPVFKENEEMEEVKEGGKGGKDAGRDRGRSGGWDEGRKKIQNKNTLKRSTPGLGVNWGIFCSTSDFSHSWNTLGGYSKFKVRLI